MQEAYCLPCIKYFICCPIPGGVPHLWTGGTLPLDGGGGYPTSGWGRGYHTSGWGGVPTSGQGYPTSGWGGYLIPGWGTPHLDLTRVPPIWTWPGYPHLDLVRVLPISGLGWGTPSAHLDMARIPLSGNGLGYPPPGCELTNKLELLPCPILRMRA